MTDRLAELATRIAARHAKSMAAWQAAQPNVTNHTCRHCGGYADKTEVYESRIGWCCKKCRTQVPDPEPTLLTLREMADETGYSLSLLRQLSYSGELPVTRIGNHVHVTRATVEGFMEAREERRTKFGRVAR